MEQELAEHRDTTEHEQQPAQSFAPTWDESDIANLGPANLPRTKPQRAWERTPASPYTRQRLRVGKVWKRAIPSALRIASEGSAPKRLKAGASPKKVVKRLCLGPEQSVGLQFERIGSPQKRILTRSRNAPEELVALSEDEEDVQDYDHGAEEEDVEGTLIEILDESGNALEVDVEDEQAGDWSDLEASGDEGPFDDTMMHMGEAVAHDSPNITPAPEHAPEDEPLQAPTSKRQPIAEEPEAATAQEESIAPAANEEPSAPRMSTTQILTPSEPLSLPDGFVSPVRRRRTVSKRLNMAAAADRRRTLPKTFAPTVEAAPVVTPSIQAEPALDIMGATSQAVDEPVDGASQVQEPAYKAIDETAKMDKGVEVAESDDDAWEDIAEKTIARDEQDTEGDDDTPTVEDFKTVHDESFRGESGAAVKEDTAYAETVSPQSPMARSGQTTHASPLHMRSLPLRRSPRRKSSSPRKQPSLHPFTDMPHLVAFSPLKRSQQQAHQPDNLDAAPIVSIEDEAQDDDQTMEDITPQSPQPLERSVSAPPEEPQMSPRRSARPRMSDDTALLQAFIDRNAVSKSSRRVSASRQEQISNRRDSDTVRQALASPAKLEVLGDLDPNSPSPRKPLDATPAQDLSASISSPTSAASEDIAVPKARRSGRDRRRAERSALGAPSKISLRGNSDPVVLKARNEAQELSNVTRQNTRKNKGGSVLPTIRLTKLAAEKTPVDVSSPSSESTGDLTVKPVKRNIRWDETLAYFQEAPSEPDSILFELGDEGSVKVQGGDQAAQADKLEDSDSKTVAIPAAETPSKPKIRRLKAPRTAANATPGRGSLAATLANEPTEATADAVPDLKPKPARRSRIATPAKGLAASSLLPADLVPAPPAAVKTKPTPAPRKKAIPSRLPAPASLSASTAQAQPPTQQSQPAHPPLSLISSPPKKRAPPPSSSFAPATKNFAPKLDFGRSATFKPAESENGSSMPGLMSPAKKGTRSFFASSVGSQGQEDRVEDEAKRKVPGLGSPAKKRTRRAM